MRTRGSVVAAAVAVVVGLVGPGQSAAADKGDGVVSLAPQWRARAAAPGSGGHDFTGDGVPDILARSTGGVLSVYPNSGEFKGTATYPSVTAINSGWGSFTWIGAADLNGDGFADVVATDAAGNMYAALHSGRFAGMSTLRAGLVYLGSGWTINDMVYVYDYNGDGLDDILARRVGSGDSYAYVNGGFNGVYTLRAPVKFMGDGPDDQYQGMADIDGDDSPDFLYVTGGYLVMVGLNGSSYAILGYGWETVNSIVVTDVDGNGRDDLIARRNSDSALLAYQRTSGWTVNPDGSAYTTFKAPVVVGYNWYVNNIIT